MGMLDHGILSLRHSELRNYGILSYTESLYTQALARDLTQPGLVRWIMSKYCTYDTRTDDTISDTRILSHDYTAVPTNGKSDHVNNWVTKLPQQHHKKTCVLNHQDQDIYHSRVDCKTCTAWIEHAKHLLIVGFHPGCNQCLILSVETTSQNCKLCRILTTAMYNMMLKRAGIDEWCSEPNLTQGCIKSKVCRANHAYKASDSTSTQLPLACNWVILLFQTTFCTQLDLLTT